MKFSSLVVLSAIATVSSEKLRAKATTPRSLSDSTVVFLASKIDENVPWCIIAGENKGDELGFNLCDFEAQPSEQLWSMDTDGKLMNNGTAALCATMSDDSDKLYMDDCSIESDKNLFSYNTTSGQIQLKSDPELCVTNRGHSPDADDSIPLLPCKDDGRFSFDFRTSDGGLIEGEGQPETPTTDGGGNIPTPVESASGAASIVSNSLIVATGSLLLVSLLF
jgi:hypothetical protein